MKKKGKKKRGERGWRPVCASLKGTVLSSCALPAVLANTQQRERERKGERERDWTTVPTTTTTEKSLSTEGGGGSHREKERGRESLTASPLLTRFPPSKSASRGGGRRTYLETTGGLKRKNHHKKAARRAAQRSPFPPFEGYIALPIRITSAWTTSRTSL